MEVAVPNVRSDSLQGDRAIIGLLERLSRPGPRRFDLGDCPDLIAPVAAAAAFADGPTELRNAAHVRTKESDRLRVLAEGFRAAGIAVEELPDGMVITPYRPAQGVSGPNEVCPCEHATGKLTLAHATPDPGPALTLDPHSDHPMAMAFGLLSLRLPHVRVADPDCVSKSYPRFWNDLALFRGDEGRATGEEQESGSRRPVQQPRATSHQLFLLGLRGSGKTTVGRLVATRLGLTFVDADEEIERRAGQTVAAIFAAHG